MFKHQFFARSVYIILLMLLFMGLQAQAIPNVNNNETRSQHDMTYTLQDIAKADTFVIRGRNPSQTLYIPVPIQWDISALTLNLIVQYSPILLNASSLSVMVDGVPVDTLQLDKRKDLPFFWRVVIPHSLINKNKDVINLQLVAYLKISDDACQDVENQGNWVTISGNSTVSYHVSKQQKAYDLHNFPYPLLHKNAPFIDNIHLILPDNVTLNSFGSYLQLANIFAHFASWRGLTFEMTQLSQLLKHRENISSHLVLIGTPKDIPFQKLDIPLPYRLGNNQWYDANGKPLEVSEGFLYITNSPWHSNQAVLIISANDKQGLETALMHIRSHTLNYKHYHPNLYLAKPGSTPVFRNILKQTVTFKDMGYPDHVVFGDGQQTSTYTFVLPANVSEDDIKLTIVYSHSPFIDKQGASYLMASLNGLPLDGIQLMPGNAAKSAIEITLPKKQIHPGENRLDFTFDLRMQAKDCSRSYLSRAWGTIYDNSHLSFTVSNQSPELQIKSFPYLLADEVTFALPETPKIYAHHDFLQNLITFSASLKQVHTLNIVPQSQLKISKQSGNVVYLGLGKDDSEWMQPLKKIFATLVNNLSATTHMTLKSINQELFTQAFEKEQGAGFAGIMPIKNHPQSTILTVYGYTLADAQQALQLLNDSFKRSFLSGNLAVAFKNGTYTSLSTQGIQAEVEDEGKFFQISQIALRVILYTTIILIVIALVYIIRRTMRNR